MAAALRQANERLEGQQDSLYAADSTILELQSSLEEAEAVITHLQVRCLLLLFCLSLCLLPNFITLIDFDCSVSECATVPSWERCAGVYYMQSDDPLGNFTSLLTPPASFPLALISVLMAGGE